MTREDGGRHIGAHRSERHRARLGHGPHDLLDVIEVIAVAGKAGGQGHLIVWFLVCRTAQRQVGDFDCLGVQPGAEGLLGGIAVAQLVVPDDTSLIRVNHQHLSRSQTSSLQDDRRVDVNGAYLACQDEAVVAGHVVAGGTQAVSVKRGTHAHAVREGYRGRSVPRLHQHGLVGVIATSCVRELCVAFPRFRNHEGNGSCEVSSVHHEKLEHVVQNGRV